MQIRPPILILNFTLIFILSCTIVSPKLSQAQLFKSSGKASLFANDFQKYWKPTNFDSQGKIEKNDSIITLHRGGYLTGITWTGPVLQTNYELSLDAKRIEGLDFFCGITFPFNDTHASLVVGGWGGYTTGLSNINGVDASENGTADSIFFEQNVWYHIRLKVTENLIQAWVDEKNILDVDTHGKRIDLRSDVSMTIPLSIISYNTTSAVRNIVLEKL